jgi:hypothetical protein
MHGLGVSFPFTLLMLNNTINPLVVAWIVHLEACQKDESFNLVMDELFNIY